MSELHNPIFDEEKEFLERKKLEYERALRGDVEHIKEQSATVGKVALVGAGLAGTVWLISKAFGGKKRRAEKKQHAGPDKGKDKHAPKDKRKSAAASAMVFMDHFESDDQEFGAGVGAASKPQAGPRAAQPVGALAQSAPKPAPAPKAAEKPAPPQPTPAKDAQFEEDPFQDLPYDDSRRLPVSHAFDKGLEQKKASKDKDEKGVPTEAMAEAPRHSIARVVGSVLQQFLQSDTGKVLVSQAGALALAAVTKKAGEFFPADKNADLAASSDAQVASSAAAPVASSAPAAAPNASTSSQSV